MVICKWCCVLQFGCNPTLCTLLAMFCLSNRPETEEERIKQINGISIVTVKCRRNGKKRGKPLKWKWEPNVAKLHVFSQHSCSFLSFVWSSRLLFFLFASGWFQHKTSEWKMELTTNDCTIKSSFRKIKTWFFSHFTHPIAQRSHTRARGRPSTSQQIYCHIALFSSNLTLFLSICMCMCVKVFFVFQFLSTKIERENKQATEQKSSTDIVFRVCTLRAAVISACFFLFFSHSFGRSLFVCLLI